VHDANLASMPYRSAKPGEIITFGTYPQTADGTDRTPIKWRVLQNSGAELLLLSEYILDCKRYHREFVDITWRDCDLRKWLNDEFYNTAFNAAEKGFVKIAFCTDNGEGSPDTEDRVFSQCGRGEAPNQYPRQGFSPCGGNRVRQGKKADGCHLYVMDKNVETDYITENGRKYGCSWWWLRTRGSSPLRAFFVGTRASIRSYARVNLARYGVRPALKLDLRIRSS